VDLSSGKTWTEPSLEYGQKYIGGRGIAARIGWDEIPPGTGPFDPENRLIIAAGPLTGTSAPNSGRATLCTLSPQAYPYEWFTYSSIGGFWGPTLKYAGYDALVIQGASDRPVYLWIDDDRVELRDARSLWGKGTFATQEDLAKEHGSDIRTLQLARREKTSVGLRSSLPVRRRQQGRAGSGRSWGPSGSKRLPFGEQKVCLSPTRRHFPTVR